MVQLVDECVNEEIYLIYIVFGTNTNKQRKQCELYTNGTEQKHTHTQKRKNVIFWLSIFIECGHKHALCTSAECLFRHGITSFSSLDFSETDAHFGWQTKFLQRLIFTIFVLFVKPPGQCVYDRMFAAKVPSQLSSMWSDHICANIIQWIREGKKTDTNMWHKQLQHSWKKRIQNSNNNNKNRNRL